MKQAFYPKRQPTPKNLMFGVHPVMEALESEREIDRILLKSGLDREITQKIESLAHSRGIPLQYVPMEKLNRLTRKNHQGVAAFTSYVEYADLQEILTAAVEKGEVPLILLLDGITDVRNFGAIARSAECAGAHAIVIAHKGAAPVNGDAMKTSAGALNITPLCRVDTVRTAVSLLHNNGIQVVAASEKGQKVIYDVDFTVPTALVMGSEEDGVSAEILRVVDASAKIPVMGSIASLNVSAAAGVILFEVVRQRRIKQ